MSVHDVTGRDELASGPVDANIPLYRCQIRDYRAGLEPDGQEKGAAAPCAWSRVTQSLEEWAHAEAIHARSSADMFCPGVLRSMCPDTRATARALNNSKSFRLRNREIHSDEAESQIQGPDAQREKTEVAGSHSRDGIEFTRRSFLTRCFLLWCEGAGNGTRCRVCTIDSIPRARPWRGWIRTIRGAPA